MTAIKDGNHTKIEDIKLQEVKVEEARINEEPERDEESISNLKDEFSI